MRIRTLILAVSALAVCSLLTLAGPFTYLVVYGDSLSDNGNLYAVSGQPPAPHWNGRVSNGPVAAEIIAGRIGATLMDFAWAGATTGVGNINDSGTTMAFGSAGLPGMKTMFDATKGSLGPIAPVSEFIVWGGAMDFIYPAEAIPQIIGRGITNLVQMTAELQAMGAARVIVPGMPDFGLTPRFAGDPVAAAGASALTDYFNALLRSSLPPGAIFFDTAALMRQIIADPSAFGLTNVTEPCLGASSICADPNSYFFWDDIHPTTATHALLADGVVSIPEPSTGLLVAPVLGLVVLVRAKRGTRAASAA